ncbi:GPP34 family phosphoprotein [Nonomuraea sp. MG754425]|uniref:GOLPH3/VPS74 family protein n=1 Tax=Nonomuraea sp. MG754425 TaxID=2570319 RepID=UPI001F21C5F9|nr:GPP34 family phosphoprotein [Nonomuraea sp. MG754425]MCF6470326.1 GPP34 family phosphoprotein [Nonomuraea sp. MG754425]
METTVKQDETLTRAAFLLAFDLRKERLANRGVLGYLLRATTLAELLLAGDLADDSGRARAVTAPAGAGPKSLRAIVWEQISASPPRPWRHWVGKDHTKAVHLVRDELAADRLIRVERHWVLVFPVQRIVPRKAYLSRRLAERVGRAVRGSRPVARVERKLGALAALAVTARLKGVVDEREAHLHRDRIRQLATPVEPIVTALHKNIETAQYMKTSGG